MLSGTGGAQVCEQDAGVCGGDVHPAVHLHAQAHVVQEKEAGVPTNAKREDTLVEGDPVGKRVNVHDTANMS